MEYDAVPTRRHPVLILSLRILLPFLFILAILANFEKLPYYVISPGSATPVASMITPPPNQAYPPKGRIFVMTVSVQQANGFLALKGWLSDDIDVQRASKYLGPFTTRQYNRYNDQLMADSEEEAKVAALRRLGIKVAEQDRGALIQAISPDSVAKELEIGDIIVAVGDQPVLTANQAVNAVRSHAPGQTVQFRVKPGDGSADRTITATLARRPDGDTGGYAGLALGTKRIFELPFPVKIDSRSIGGPSAGLSFTLGVLDELTPGELTGGKKVAVSGTIDVDGKVGPVGGVKQKTAAVRAAHADLFIVPAGDYKEAKRHAGKHLKVVAVSSLEDALSALRKVGGNVDQLPPAPPAISAPAS